MFQNLLVLTKTELKRVMIKPEIGPGLGSSKRIGKFFKFKVELIFLTDLLINVCS